MNDIPAGRYDHPGRYEIRLKGHLDRSWTAWFDGWPSAALCAVRRAPGRAA
jgi:hypothetical protein